MIKENKMSLKDKIANALIKKIARNLPLEDYVGKN
jgi:hypothetical protein